MKDLFGSFMCPFQRLYKRAGKILISRIFSMRSDIIKNKSYHQ